MKNPISIIATSLLFAVGAVFAQEEPGPETSLEDARTIRFYCLADSMPQYFYDVRKNEQTAIGSASGSLSLPHPMPADRVLEVYRVIPPPPEAPVGTKPLKQIMGTSKIPAGFSKAIVLLLPEGGSKAETLRVAAFGDSYRIHPRGMVRVFNLAPWEISLKVGDSTNRFKPGQEAIVPWSDRTSNVVVFQTCVRSGDAWRILGTNELATRPNLRAFMFAYQGIPDVSSKICFDAVPDEE